MDRIARGDYVRAGGATYLVVQHNALAELPTLVVVPALSRPLPHRRPLVVRDDANDVWVHTFAPATLLRGDITTVSGHAIDEVMRSVEDALAALLELNPLETASHLQGAGLGRGIQPAAVGDPTATTPSRATAPPTTQRTGDISAT